MLDLLAVYAAGSKHTSDQRYTSRNDFRLVISLKLRAPHPAHRKQHELTPRWETHSGSGTGREYKVLNVNRKISVPMPPSNSRRRTVVCSHRDPDSERYWFMLYPYELKDLAILGTEGTGACSED